MGPENQESAPLDLSLAGESRRAYDSELLPQRLEMYAKLHQRALDVADYIHTAINCNNPPQNDTDFNKFVALVKRKQINFKLHSCGNFLLFRNYYTVNETRLHKANFCKNHLLCPLCGLRRGSKYAQAYNEKVQFLMNENPKIWPYLVTITVKDGPDLAERFNHLKSGIDIMTNTRREALKGRRQPIEMNKAMGGVSAYEVKRGLNSGVWHPHYHAIWLCENQPFETKISEDWHNITSDSFIVDVRKLDLLHNDVSSFLEVFAYALKFSTLSFEDNIEAFRKLHRKRLINSFGILRGVEIPEQLEDEPLENLPYAELMFRFFKGSGYNYMKPGEEMKGQRQTGR